MGYVTFRMKLVSYGWREGAKKKKKKELDKDNTVVTEVGRVMGGGKRGYRVINGNGKIIKCINK